MNEPEAPARSGAVVVGVDGSAGASAALRWAAGEARLRQDRLRVVHAWTFAFAGVPSGGGFGYMGGTLDPFMGEGGTELRQAAEALLERLIAEAATELDGIEVERQVVEGGPAQALVGAAGEDDLLVVGSRGHGGFAGLLLGSVSQQCAHHARCPVVIVHPAEKGSSPSGSEAQRGD